MKYYNASTAPRNIPLWAVAYHIDNNNERRILKCFPTKGEIRSEVKNCFMSPMFYAYRKNGIGFVTSKGIDCRSRCYADTYEEAVELYNELVQKRIDSLKQSIEQAISDKI